MTRLVRLSIFLFVCTTPALADLKPDIVECDAQKAARNAALDATVGVSGGCDADKLAKETKKDAKEAVTPDKAKKKDKDKGLLGKDKDKD